MKNRMDAWKAGEMHPGTGKLGGKRPALTHSKKDFKQAVAIALNMSGSVQEGTCKEKELSNGR